MTVKEMSETIENYCCGDCNECRLLNFVTRGDVTTNCYSYIAGDAESEAVVAENYEFLFGKSESEPVPENDSVNHPSHYCQEGSMECIDEMIVVFGKGAVMNFCLLNVWKYRKRAVFKNGEEV